MDARKYLDSTHASGSGSSSRFTSTSQAAEDTESPTDSEAPKKIPYTQKESSQHVPPGVPGPSDDDFLKVPEISLTAEARERARKRSLHRSRSPRRDSFPQGDGQHSDGEGPNSAPNAQSTSPIAESTAPDATISEKLKATRKKLKKKPDRLLYLRQRDLEALSEDEKKQRKLKMIKERLNNHGIIACIITSFYLICFGVAWQEHHRWNKHDKEKRPPPSQPFAMWILCLVWISIALVTNSIAIRSIYKLAMFGRKYRGQWTKRQWRWEWFANWGLAICFVVGSLTVVAFSGTIVMMRSALALEIERGYVKIGDV
ncbi:hypothetical protein ABW20_dc0108994 [Dactylellina cionopaga]|nr:hypothetical protein ABW20_dc0108994 [Dactylellina cionopaga]